MTLRCDGIAVERGGRRILDAVGFAAPAGAVTAVLGPNGGGKSTLIMACAGLLPLAAGAAYAGDDPVASLPLAERARRLAYVPQRSELAAPVRVRDVVAMGRYAADALSVRGDGDRAAVDAALAAVEATPLADRPFTALSGGEAQRVLLARALATGAPILLLDEPTSALDIAHRLRFAALLRALAAQGRAIVVALHDVNEVAEVADAVVVLTRGAVAAAGPRETTLTPELIRSVYGVDLAPGGWRYRLAP